MSKWQKATDGLTFLICFLVLLVLMSIALDIRAQDLREGGEYWNGASGTSGDAYTVKTPVVETLPYEIWNQDTGQSATFYDTTPPGDGLLGGYGNDGTYYEIESYWD